MKNLFKKGALLLFVVMAVFAFVGCENAVSGAGEKTTPKMPDNLIGLSFSLSAGTIDVVSDSIGIAGISGIPDGTYEIAKIQNSGETVAVTLGAIKAETPTVTKNITAAIFANVSPVNEVSESTIIVLSITEKGDGGFSVKVTVDGVEKISVDDVPLLYLIVFDSNGGTGVMAPQRVKRGENVILSANTFTRDGYTFNGWKVKGEETTYVDKATITNVLKFTTLEALWQINNTPSYTVTYNLNGGSGTAPTQASVTSGTTFTVKSYNGTKDGFTFDGWNDGKANYAAGSTYTMGSENVTLTAQWKVKQVISATTKVKVTLKGTEVTVTPDTSSSKGLKAALHETVTDTNRQTITKITIVAPSDGSKIIPEEDLSKLFYDPNILGGVKAYKELLSIEGLEHIDTSNVTNMSEMFKYCDELTILDLSSFNTENVSDMSSMFDECSKLTTLNVSSFNTGKVTNMEKMFSSCNYLTALNVSSFNTENVTDMSAMFSGIFRLTELNVSNFNTGKVTDMNSMFSHLRITSLDVSNFDTKNVTNMSFMFNGSDDITAFNLSNFNTENVTNMSYMFQGVSVTSLDLSNLNTEKVTDMTEMFDECEELKSLNISGWKTPLVTETSTVFGKDGSTDMFKKCFLLKRGDIKVEGAVLSDVVQQQINKQPVV